MKRFATLGAFFIVALFAGAAVAGSIKFWTAGEYITAADLNANFTHLHTTMVGGHGPRLVNADVAANANIATSKLAAIPLIPRSWAQVIDSASPTLASFTNVSSCTRPLTGVYNCNFASRPDANYAVFASSSSTVTTSFCKGSPSGNSTIVVNCINSNTGAQVNSDFNFFILDNT